MRVPGVVTGTVRWQPQQTELAFEVDENHMRIRQDRTLIAQRAITPELASRLRGATFTWGKGACGKFPGTLVPTVVRV